MPDKPNHRPVEFLLVEDDPDDVWYTEHTFKESKLLNNLHVATDGERAIAFLHRRDEFADAPRPDLIFLDLNLPKRDGRELLADLSASPELRDIPVVVLTTSQAEEDIIRAHELNCHSYIAKPIRVDHLIMLIQSLDNFGVTIVKCEPSG